MGLLADIIFDFIIEAVIYPFKLMYRMCKKRFANPLGTFR